MKLSEICGTGVAIVTPFTNEDKIDFAALGNVIEHVIAGGVQNIVSLGTTGEVATLSTAEKIEIIHFTLDKVERRVPVIVGVGGNNTQAVVEDLKTFPLEEVVAVLSVAPYYSKPSDEGLYQHYKALAEASPKPIVLYNVPGRSARIIPVDIIVRLAHDFENIVGVKDATGDLAFNLDLLRKKPKDFTVVSGDDLLSLSQIALGMEGVISVAANFYAKEMTDLIQKARAGEIEKAQKILYSLTPALHYMFEENNPSGIKAFLASAGFMKEHLRLPLVPVKDALKEKIENYIKVDKLVNS